MILFCVDQVAGAEYILPLLRRWQQQGRLDWRVCSGPRSAPVLQANQIPVTLLGDDLVNHAQQLIADLRPRLVLMSSSAGSAIEAIFRQCLRGAGIPCVQFIDMWVNYAVRFQDAAGKFDFPDQLLALDEPAKQAMVREGLPLERIVVIGQPYFEVCLEASAKNEEIAPNSGRTLVVTQPVSRHLGKRLGYDETDFVEGVLQAWQQAECDWKQLDIIVHPDEDRQAYREKLNRYSTGIRIIDNAGLNLLHYSLIIGMYSSLMIHAMLSRVNTVSFQPNAIGLDACHLSAQEMVKRMTTTEQLRHYLLEADPAERDNILTTSIPLLSAIEGSCDRLEQFLLS